MTRRDLAPELDRAELGYDEPLATLKLVDGEQVVVRIDPRDAARGPEAGLASIVGQLRFQETARYEGYEISIGDPYPERYPEHLAGGILFLDEASFETAALRTFDGNDYFAISITTRSVTILIGDGDSTPP